MDDVTIRGRRGSLHFIRFPTSEMINFISLAKAKGMAELVTTVCATGGGAFKFENKFKEVSVSLEIIDLKRECFCCLLSSTTGGEHETGQVRRTGRPDPRHTICRDTQSSRVLLL